MNVHSRGRKPTEQTTGCSGPGGAEPKRALPPLIPSTVGSTLSGLTPVALVSVGFTHGYSGSSPPGIIHGPSYLSCTTFNHALPPLPFSWLPH